jgi:hypothetical protein
MCLRVLFRMCGIQINMVVFKTVVSSLSFLKPIHYSAASVQEYRFHIDGIIYEKFCTENTLCMQK